MIPPWIALSFEEEDLTENSLTAKRGMFCSSTGFNNKIKTIIIFYFLCPTQSERNHDLCSPGLPHPGCAPGVFPAAVAISESTTGKPSPTPARSRHPPCAARVRPAPAALQGPWIYLSLPLYSTQARVSIFIILVYDTDQEHYKRQSGNLLHRIQLPIL